MSCTVCRSLSMLTNSWTVICSSEHQGHYKRVTATVHLHLWGYWKIPFNCQNLLNMYYLYLCICTSAKCMSVELKVYLFIWSHNFRFSMPLSLSPNSLYRQTTDCTEGGGNYKKGCTRLAAASGKVYQLLAQGRWFSQGTPASSTTKTGLFLSKIKIHR
jgi:hypothetical protein